MVAVNKSAITWTTNKMALLFLHGKWHAFGSWWFPWHKFIPQAFQRPPFKKFMKKKMKANNIHLKKHYRRLENCPKVPFVRVLQSPSKTWLLLASLLTFDFRNSMCTVHPYVQQTCIFRNFHAHLCKFLCGQGPQSASKMNNYHINSFNIRLFFNLDNGFN